MRIHHVVDTMEVGGAEMLVAHLCRMQRQRGCSPSVDCLFRNGSVGDQLEADGISVRLHGGGNTLRLCWCLFRSFLRTRPHVVHCHNAQALIAGAVAARLAGASAVIGTRHGLVAPPYRRRQEIKFSAASRLADAIVGVCEATTENLRRAPFAAKKVMRTVYNGAPEVAAAVRQPDDRNSFIVISVGRLAKPKDHATLLRAVALSSGSVPNLKLWVVGDGPLMGELRSLALELHLGGVAHFWGEREDVGELLRRSDLFVLSSRSEGLPMSLIEALSAGLPALVSDVGGMSEVVRGHGCGAVFTTGDEKGLSRLIAEWALLAKSPRLKEAARTLYDSRFTLNRMVEEYMRIYETATAHAKR